MKLHIALPAVFGIAAMTAGLATSASAQMFTYTATFGTVASSSLGTNPSTTPPVDTTASLIPTSQSGNFFSYQSGADSHPLSANGFGSAIVLANYTTTASSANRGTVSTPYAIDITINDLGTGQSQTQTVTGNLAGYLAGGVNKGAMLKQTYDQDSLDFAFTDGTYTINNFDLVSPGAPGGIRGTTGADVTFTAGTNTIPAAAPEPGSFAMAGLGLFGMIGGAFRARRRRAAK